MYAFRDEKLTDITLSVFNMGAKLGSLKLREKHRLWVIEGRVLKVMIGPKREEAKGDWRKLHNGELLDS
jgi:hypothetical protein